MILLSATHQLDYCIPSWPSSYPEEYFGCSEEKKVREGWFIEIVNASSSFAFAF